jgi:hypothetical protein
MEVKIKNDKTGKYKKYLIIFNLFSTSYLKRCSSNPGPDKVSADLTPLVVYLDRLAYKMKNNKKIIKELSTI